MEVTLIARSKYVARKLEQDFYWYDSVSKQMFYGRGGRMDFVYKPEQKRSVPVIVDADERVWGNNFSDIQSWVSKHADDFNASIVHVAPNRYITVELNAINFEDLRSELYRRGIDIDYNEAELKNEIRYITGASND